MACIEVGPPVHGDAGDVVTTTLTVSLPAQDLKPRTVSPAEMGVTDEEWAGWFVPQSSSGPYPRGEIAWASVASPPPGEAPPDAGT